MPEYVEIEDPKAIAQWNRVLSNRLRDALRHAERREIGWPAGRFQARVRFLSNKGDAVFWWTDRTNKSGAVAVNLFGRGNPGGTSSLNIDVQFNLPVVKFSRMTGGAFLKDEKTGRVLLAHRGIVTLGHGRILKNDLYKEMACTLREAETSKGTREFFLIGELASPSIVDDILSFATELRRSAKVLGATSPRASKTTVAKGKTLARHRKALGKLRDYFDESVGKRKVKNRRNTVIADCYHGAVVRAMRDSLGVFDQALKSREIDLVALTTKKAFIVEVKTSASTQNLYTAIGQLMVHAPHVAKYARGLKIEKVIVLPEKPPDPLFYALTELGIRVLTFIRSTSGRVTISGTAGLL